MKTEVVMCRPIFGQEVRQKSKSEFLCASDLVKVGNVERRKMGLKDFRLNEWMKAKATQEFLQDLEQKYGKVTVQIKKEMWFHPLLFIDLALALHPKLKVEAYEWLYDQLLKNRDSSGDSYKLMSGAIYTHFDNKAQFPRYISTLATHIQKICGVEDWQRANQNQLRLRDKIHSNIALVANVLRDPNQAVEIGIREALKTEGLQDAN